MNLTIPIYVEVRREQGQQIHACRPLFFTDLAAGDAHLGLAMSKLGRRMKQWFDEAGGRLDHHQLASLAFNPAAETHVVKLALEIDNRIVRVRYLFVVLPVLGRQIAFSPSLPEVWFEIAAGETLENRATEVFAHHFRREAKLARKHGGLPLPPEETAIAGQAWVTSLDLDVTLNQKAPNDELRKFLALLEQGRMDGGQELARVGRCLDWLYPDELHQPTERDREIEQLDRLLRSPDLRPVVLVGPRLAGKTAVLHGCVRRRVSRRKKTYAAKENVWLLSPQRLISGMMYVGQWEGRVEAILRTAKKRGHILYFDDFLGLYRAGISRDASLSVAEVLKPAILRREVRVLAEMSPETWHKFQEHDRGLADQFHVLRIDPMGEAATRRVLIDVQRQLEAEQRCRFELDALPSILQLHTSFVRDAEFPGKAAAFARQLARKHARQPITRHEVQAEFHRRTGIAPELLDDQRRMDRKEVIRRLAGKVIGQTAAVEAAADVVTVAKARLADTQRPLGVFLFLGPTGVGKTQCAKALAEVMYSDPGRLLRFDMNQYVSPTAASQLVGTFGEPDGLLTSAVRQQPFSIVLLDEIEKAHPDVFDLLLQVTGEGRLTDALGRTADFTNTVIVMTSNLGTASGQPIGLGAEHVHRGHQFVRAAEQFFRPEFVNRIDRIIPFDPLSRDEMRGVARLLLESVLGRDGLVRRRCVLTIEDAALERIVDAGYHPQFGARALKRAIERQLVQPVAATLAGVRPELPAVIHVLPQPEGVTAVVHSLESVPPVAASTMTELVPGEQLGRVQQFIARAAEEIDAIRPRSTGAKLGSAEVRYYALREHLHRVRDLTRNLIDTVRAIERMPDQPRIAPKQGGAGKSSKSLQMSHREVPTRRFLRDIQAAEDIHEYLHEVAVDNPHPSQLEERLAALRQEASMLEALLASVEAPEDVLILIRPLVPAARSHAIHWCHRLRGLLTGLSYRADWLTLPDPYYALHAAGPGIWPLAAAEGGVHVWALERDALAPVHVLTLPVTSRDARQEAAMAIDARATWLAQVGRGEVAAASDPWPLGSMVRLHEERGPSVDLRTGQSVPSLAGFEAWQGVLLAGLPQPPEFEEVQP